MRREDCLHHKEFDFLGYRSMENIDFTNWLSMLTIQINAIAKEIHDVNMYMYANTLIVSPNIRNLLVLSMCNIYKTYDINSNKFGKYDIEVDDTCDDNTIYVLMKADAGRDKFMPEFKNIEPVDGSPFTRTISFILKSSQPKEVVEKFEKSTRGYIILKNNFIHEP